MINIFNFREELSSEEAQTIEEEFWTLIGLSNVRKCDR